MLYLIFLRTLKSFWLRQELRESHCLSDRPSSTSLCKTMILHLSLIDVSQVGLRSVLGQSWVRSDSRLNFILYSIAR